jgi:hypothetical protein
MNKKWFTPLNNPSCGSDAVRITVALIIAVHGVHGILNPQKIAGFGGYLGLLAAKIDACNVARRKKMSFRAKARNDIFGEFFTISQIYPEQYPIYS